MAKENRHNKILLRLSLVAAFYLSLADAHQDGYNQKDNGNPGGIITRCDAPGTNGYFVSRDKYPYSGAAAACKALGGSLADLSNQSFLFGADMLLTCAGPNTKAWIGSWDYSGSNKDETSDQNCLSINVGSIGPGGGIDRACAGDKHVVCQLQLSSTPHNSLYSQVEPVQQQFESLAPVHGYRSQVDLTGTSHAKVRRPQPYVPNPYPNSYPYPYPYPYPAPVPYNGGYPGGIFPGGPGYGNGGYPYGYPGKNHGGKDKNWHDKNHGGSGVATVYETVTLQGIITTVTIGGVERTVTIAGPAATVTNDIIQTVIIPSEPITITKLVNGLPVTVTAQVEPATVTLTGQVVTKDRTITDLQQTTQTVTQDRIVTNNIIQTVVIPSEPITVTKLVDGVPVTITALVEPATVTLTGQVITNTVTALQDRTITNLQQTTQTVTQDRLVTNNVIQTVVIPSDPITITKLVNGIVVTVTAQVQPATVTLTGQVITDTITAIQRTTQTVTQDRIVTNNIIQTVVIPSEPITITKMVNGLPVTVTATVQPATVTLTGQVVTNTVTALQDRTITNLQQTTQTVTQDRIVTNNVIQTVVIPSEPITITKLVNGIVVTVTAQVQPATVTLTGQVITATATVTNIQDRIITSTQKTTQTIIAATNSRGQTMYDYDGYTLPVIIPDFHGQGTYTLGPETVIEVKADGSFTYQKGGTTITPTAGGGGITLPFNVPNYTGPGTYTLAPGSTVVINGDGSYSFINGGGNNNGGGGFSYNYNGISYNLPFSVDNFHGPGIYLVKPGGGLVQVNPDGTFNYLVSPTSLSGGATVPPNVPTYTGPGTYTLGPGTAVAINSATYSFIGSGGGVSFNFPFPIDNFQGPGIYAIKPGGLIEVFSDGSYSYLVSPQTRQGATSLVPSNVPTYTGAGSYTVGPSKSVVVVNPSSFSFINAPPVTSSGGFTFPFNIPNFTGPGTYTLSPSSTVVVNIDGSYSFIGGNTATSSTTAQGQSEYSYSLNGVTFKFPFQIPNFTGPGIYSIPNGGIVQVNPDGTYNYIVSPKTRVGATTTLASNVPTYTGPGTYTLGPSSAVVYDGNVFTFVNNNGGSPSFSYNFNGISFNLPFSIPNFTGPGIYATAGGGLVQVNIDGSYNYIISPTSRPGATSTLPANIPTYTGPGTYSLGPSSAAVFNGISFSFINNNGGSPSFSYNFNGISFNLPFNIPNFTGPGIYATAGGGLIQVNLDGSYRYIVSPTSRPGATSTLPANIPTFTGAGTYSIGPSSAAVFDGVSFSFINNNGGFPSFSYNFNGISFNLPFSIPNFTGPGIYVTAGGGLVQVNIDGSYKYIISPTSRPGATSTLPANIPTYTGPGTYSVGPSSAVFNGISFSFINNNGGSPSFSYNFNGISFNLPFNIPNFTGPGIYATAGGGLIQVNLDGSYRYIVSPTSRSGATSTLPANIPTFTGAGTYSVGPSSAAVFDGVSFSFINNNGGFPSFSYNFNGISFNFPFSIPNFAGPGIYVTPSGGLVQINLDGSYKYIISPTSRPGATSTLPANIPTFTGSGTYSLGPSSIAVFDGKSYSFITGGGNGGGSFSYNFNGITFNLPFNIPNFTGPGIYATAGGGLIQVNIDGSYNYIVSPTSRPGATSTLPANIPTFTGAGTYSVGPSSAAVFDGVSFSFFNNNGGFPSFSYNFNGISFKFPFSIPNFTGPGIYVTAGGGLVQINLDGSYNYIVSPTSRPGATSTLPANIPTFTGAGTYSVGPSSAAVFDGVSFSFFNNNGGFPSFSYNFNGISFKFPFSIPNFTGPGIYATAGGGLVQINLDGSYNYIVSPTSRPGATSTLPANIPTYTGAGTYSVGPSSAVVYNGISFSFINNNGGFPSFSYNFNGISFKFPFSIPNFAGPGIYVTPGGGLVQINLDGSYNYIVSPTSRPGATSTLPASIPTFTGAGTYSAGPSSNVVYDGNTYSFINNNGGFPSYSYNYNGLTFNFPFAIPNFTGPGIYALSPDGLVQVNKDGAYTYIVSPKSRPGLTSTLPANIPTFTGSGTYSAGPSSNVIYDGKSFSFINNNGGFPSYSYNYNGLTFNFPFSIPNFTGPGIYALKPDGLVQINADGTYNYIVSPKSRPGLTSTLPANIPTFTGPATYSVGSGTSVSYDGTSYSFITAARGFGYIVDGVTYKFPFAVDGFSGPGYYLIKPDTLIQVLPDGTFNYIVSPSTRVGPTSTVPANVPTYSGPGTYTIGTNGVSLAVISSNGFSIVSSSANSGFSYTVGGKTYNFPFAIPNFYGPGVYILGSNLVVQVNPDGTFTYLSGGPSFTITSKSATVTTPTGPQPFTLTLPVITYPSFDLPFNQGRISSYSGDGIYTINANTIVSLGPGGSYSFIKGNGLFLPKTGSFGIPTFAFPTLSLGFSFNIPNFSGPGIYTVSPGNVVSINPLGGVSWVLGGPDGAINTGSINVGGFSFPGLTLPSVTLPTLNLGNFVVSGFTGAGTYTPSPGNVIYLNSNGVVSVVSGTGLGGPVGGLITVPGLTLPKLNFPTLTLPGGYAVNGYTGPGVYTVGTGTVISVDNFGGVRFIQGSPSGTATNNLNGFGFTFPTLSFPVITLPTFSFSPLITLPSINIPFFGNGASDEFVAAGVTTMPASDSVSRPTSEGFVLPGFSLSGFTRRVVGASSSASEEALPSAVPVN